MKRHQKTKTLLDLCNPQNRRKTCEDNETEISRHPAGSVESEACKELYLQIQTGFRVWNMQESQDAVLRTTRGASTQQEQTSHSTVGAFRCNYVVHTFRGYL
ncbi:hypothetical protein KUCAC02_018024 [Chaenocephalus aceratus]|uniref:Uncharacterized protein n=1 Tax=Chaenocephalus aceratus TaxID=36190 RepID=A0ACB9W8Z9_CHAAC|nr:hypothetical protein KUCAC02_018024 [Chaenocephalus aceratus]